VLVPLKRGFAFLKRKKRCRRCLLETAKQLLISQVLYVDKEKPGWDCTARKPTSGWKRAKEANNDNDTE
jgi:hypothetical protein